MSDLKVVVLSNILIKIAYCVCVTVAAIHFNDSGILWWYLCAFMFGYSYHHNDGKESKNEQGIYEI